MITYEHRYWGLPLLGRLYGSAFPRAFLFATLAAIETAVLFEFAPAYISVTLKNPTIFQIFGFVVGFAVVFRSSLSYNRFWEARTMLQSLTGRLTYFTIETIAADLGSMDHDIATEVERKAAHRFCNELLHLVSLMYGLMVKHLRKDHDLNTLYPHDITGKPPYLDSNVGVRGWKRWEVFVVRVLALNDLFAIAIPHQEVDVPVIGGLRDDERARLQDLMPIPSMKGYAATLNGARPYAVFALINQLYIRRIKEGGLRTLPPLASRLGGIAEEGMAAFGHCSKLASTQFPFPWAQVVMAFLAILALLMPFVVTSFVTELWMGVVLSFVVVLTYWSLNEVASEMEDPFGFDPNDLPLARYAFDFNNGILAATHQLRPPYFDELDAEVQQHEQQRRQQRGQLSDLPGGVGEQSDVEDPVCLVQVSGDSGGGSRCEKAASASNGAGGAGCSSSSSLAATVGGSPGGGAAVVSGGGPPGDSAGGLPGSSPDRPSTPLYGTLPGATSGNRLQAGTPNLSKAPSRWLPLEADPANINGVADVAAAAAAAAVALAAASTSAAASPLAAVSLPAGTEPRMSRYASASCLAGETLLEPLGSMTRRANGSSGGAAAVGSSGVPPSGAAVVFATPFSRQPSGRCDSPRIARKTAVLPVNN